MIQNSKLLSCFSKKNVIIIIIRVGKPLVLKLSNE